MADRPTNRTTFVLNPAARGAIKAFRDSKPWQGTREGRGAKFAELHRGLCRAYDLETMLVREDNDSSEDTGTSTRSRVDLQTNKIILRGRLSVVTYLFLFAAAATGGNIRPADALTFARDQFRHFFPRSYAGCRDAGGLMIRLDVA